MVADDEISMAEAIARLLLDPQEWAARRRDVEQWCAGQSTASIGAGDSWRHLFGLDVSPEPAEVSGGAGPAGDERIGP